MLRNTLALLCLPFFLCFLVAPAHSASPKPTRVQVKRAARVAGSERAPKLSAAHRGLLEKLTRAMKKRDKRAARAVWKKLRKHPKRARLLDYALFHGIVIPQAKKTRVARKYRFYVNQQRRLAAHLRSLRAKARKIGSGKVRVSMLRTARYRDGGAVVIQKGSRRLDRAGLSDAIKEVESMQETVRNKRQMASTAFQNFDQKSNQLYNLISSVMKAMNEMRQATVRNML